jgi:hypothetical protein
MTKPIKKGRRKKSIDYALVKKLASIHCTQEEIADVLELSVRTLQRDEDFCRIYKANLATFKTLIRRWQVNAAKKGNPGMLIWLGKQYLQQREPKEIVQDEPERIPEFDSMSETELNEYIDRHRN